jgi:hypothetical protein
LYCTGLRYAGANATTQSHGAARVFAENPAFSVFFPIDAKRTMAGSVCAGMALA